MTKELTKLTLTESLKGLENKDFTSVELTGAYIKNIEDNQNLNAFITNTFELALDQAKKADGLRAKGQGGKIAGIPLAIKDAFCTKGVRTTSASQMLKNFVPPYESTVTQKLWGEGGVMLGKTNMDEFAMGSTGTTSHFGATTNPYHKKGDDTDLVPGGSSSGSCTAVAANLCVAATGTDTAGSIRQPASFTNTVGVKPTYGRCSRYGIVALVSSLDQAGVITKSVEDSALLLEIISGYDSKDATCANVAVPSFAGLLNADIKGKRIGIPKEYKMDEMPAEIDKLWQEGVELLKSKGAEIVDVSLPHTKYAAIIYSAIAYGEASTNLSRYDGVRYGYRTKDENISLDEMYERSRTEGFGEEVKKRILTGTYFLASENYESFCVKSQKIRRLIAEDFKKVFSKVDAIFAPTTPNTAFPIQQSEMKTVKSVSSNFLNDALTVPANFAGLPAISVPFGFSKEGLPIGMQVITDRFNEQAMFDIALAVESK